MSVRVMSWVWEQSRSVKTQRLVLLAIADCASDDGGNAYPSMAELMRKTGLSERGVQSSIKELTALGELHVSQNGGPKGCNRYRVLMTPADAAPPHAVHPARRAVPRSGEAKQVKPKNPARGAPPAGNAPPQRVHPTPAGRAGGTVLEPSENSSSKSSKGVRGTRIPDDFTVTPEMVAWALDKTPHVNGRLETEKFTNYWRAKAGSGAIKRDWILTWKNWMLTAAERSGRPAGRTHQPYRDPDDASVYHGEL